MKPKTNFMKCNIDVSFCTIDKLVGSGIIIRDHNGHFVKAQTIQITPILQGQEGKAKALLHSINWIIELGLVNVIFEMDDVIVVDAFNNPKVDDMSEFGSTIYDCHKLVDEYLPNSTVVFAMKKANKAASVLACVALDMVCPQVYDHVPLCIASIVFKEM